MFMQVKISPLNYRSIFQSPLCYLLDVCFLICLLVNRCKYFYSPIDPINESFRNTFKTKNKKTKKTNKKKTKTIMLKPYHQWELPTFKLEEGLREWWVDPAFATMSSGSPMRMAILWA